MTFRPLALILAVATVLTLLPAAAPADVDPAARRAERIERMKAQQHQMLMGTARRREARAKKRLNAWREHQRKLRGERLKPATPLPGQPGSAYNRIGVSRLATSGATPANLAAIASNVAVSNPATDVENASGQSEVMIASDGNNVMAAWNDGEGFGAAASYQGVAYSTNGGASWTDAGSPPVVGGVGKWSSDPTIAVNEKTHKFYFCSLVDPSGTTNGIGVVEATIGAGGITWGTPKLVVSSTNSTALYDKQWIVADSLTGNLYLTYVRFGVSGGVITTNQIEFRRSTDGNVNWGSAVVLSSTNDAGYVQGPRPAVGPAGDVYATWYAIGKTNNSAYGRDFFRFKRSTTQGLTFGTEVTVDSVMANWGMGAPGFNRGNGVTFPGITVDRSTGPQRGRVYVTWNEAFNFYWDDLGTTNGPVESESNNTAGTADPFTFGQELRGQITVADADWWSFAGTAGQSVVVYVDSIAATLDLALDLMCTSGNSTLGYSALGQGAGALVVATLPVTGTYYLRVAANDGFSSGRYNLATGFHVPQGGALADRARDVRDIYVKWSDGGGAAGTWSAPVRANNTPANFDDWLPEVVVAGASGKPFVGWYAFHDYPAGMCAGVGGNYYLSRSEDGGATWAAGSPVSTVTVNWTQVQSNIQPNQGDYVALWGDPTAVHASWADGRTGDPDVYAARVDLVYTAVQVALANASATPDEVSLAWHAGGAASLAATLEKRSPGADWAPIGTLIADGAGRLEARDGDVVPGERYGYRLRIVDEGAERVVGETWVDVPARFQLALAGARPNPASGDVWIAFTLPNREAATLELVDVTGRRVAERRLEGFGPGSHTVNLTEGRRLSAGVYVARLQQGGRTLTSRVSVIR